MCLCVVMVIVVYVYYYVDDNDCIGAMCACVNHPGRKRSTITCIQLPLI